MAEAETKKKEVAVERPPAKKVADSAVWLSEVVGDLHREGDPVRSALLLDVFDMVAGRVAYAHSGGRVVTVSFDRVDLSVVVLHGDLVTVSGSLVSVGSSSMLIQVICERFDPYLGEKTVTHRCFVTMVAVQEDGRPRKGIAPLDYDGQDDEKRATELAAQRRSIASAWADMVAGVEAQRGKFKASDLETEHNRTKKERVRVRDTDVRTRKQFLPRHRNNSMVSIFGGDLLLSMYRTAHYTGKVFLGTTFRLSHVVSMMKVVFKRAITVEDLVEMRARVCFVTDCAIVVEISVFVIDVDHQREPTKTHTGYFTIANLDPGSSNPRPVPKGLALDDADQDELMSYAMGRAQHEFANERENKHDEEQ